MKALRVILLFSLVFIGLNVFAQNESNKHSQFDYEKTLFQAKSGEIEGMLSLAAYHAQSQEYELMIFWMKKAADLGSPEAQWSLASVLAKIGSYKDAIKYIRLSWQKNHLLAMGMGWSSVFLKIPPEVQTKELREEFLLHAKEACNLNMYFTCYVLGEVYRTGEGGVDIDKNESDFWHKKDAHKMKDKFGA